MTRNIYITKILVPIKPPSQAEAVMFGISFKEDFKAA
jgi:hypothetical protein